MLKIAVLLLLFFLAAGSINAQEERKFQIWNINAVSVKLNKKLSFEASEKVHITPESGGINLKYGDLWVKQKVSDLIQLAGGFRLLYSRNEAGWQEERRPMFMLNLMPKWDNFKLSFSNRIEYRFYEVLEDHFRYREMINLDFPSFSDINMNFYLSEEAFYKLNKDKLHLARFYAGIQTFNSEHFEMKIYYVLEKSKTTEYWNSTDVVGMNFKFVL